AGGPSLAVAARLSERQVYRVLETCFAIDLLEPDYGVQPTQLRPAANGRRLPRGGRLKASVKATAPGLATRVRLGPRARVAPGRPYLKEAPMGDKPVTLSAPPKGVKPVTL